MKKLTPEALLEAIVVSLVEKPEEVKVDRQVDEMGVLLTVKVADGDAGLVIGKNGSIAQAIRQIIRSIGFRSHARINIKIDVPDKAPEKKKEKAEDVLGDL